MNLELTPDQREFRKYVAEYVDERVVPSAGALDRSGEFPHEIFRELGRLGYLGIKYPEQYGGSDLPDPNVHYTIFCEELARGSLGVAAVVGVHTSTATYAVYKSGSEELKQKYLVPALAGDKIAAFGLTEPDAGSDVSALRTRAVRNGDAYVLNGRKMFISNASVADFTIIAAKTDEALGIHGISLFLVDMKTPGVTVGNKFDKLSIRCSDTGEMVLEDVVVPADCLLGEENRGLLGVFESLDIDRIMTAAMCIGLGRAAYDTAAKYAGERIQFGRPIADFQAVRFKLVDMYTKLETARLCTYAAACRADQGQGVRKEAAIAKNVAAEAANFVAAGCVSILGGYGLMTEFPAERYLRDSFFPMVGGGTVDIMKVVIADEIGL